MSRALQMASRLAALPGLGLVSRAANRAPGTHEIEGYLTCQRLAQEAARKIAGHLREGWSERQTADLLDTYLRDCGVQSFFHQSFVWFGERTRFAGVRTYWDYLPSATRVVRPGEPFILDVAPILDGYICDIGYTAALGEHRELASAMAFLGELRRELPGMFAGATSGGEVWRAIDARLTAAGYDNVHARYPFSVLGHRVHRVRSQAPALSFINFGWQSYWEFLSRGLFGQLLNQDFAGDLTGLWAIEPHVGGAGFGAKFEEILIVEGGKARWLDP